MSRLAFAFMPLIFILSITTNSLTHAAEVSLLRQENAILQQLRNLPANVELPAFRNTLGLSAIEKLEKISQHQDRHGLTHTRYKQTFKGIPVWGEHIIVTHGPNGNVKALHGRYVRNLASEIHQIQPAITAKNALASMKSKALSRSSAPQSMVFSREESELVIYISNGEPVLSYAVSFFADLADGGEPTRPVYIVDAINGDVLFEYEGLAHAYQVLKDGESVAINGSIRSWNYYEFIVPADSNGLLGISISGGSGDADLYVNKNTIPSSSDYLCRPWINGNDEQCSFNASEGTWYIGIYGYRKYNNVSLVASISNSNAATVQGTGPGGNIKIGRYQYGADYAGFDVSLESSICTMLNTNVKTVNLNHGTSGSTAFDYDCSLSYENTVKQINGAYSPLNDAHYFGDVVFDMYNDYLGVPPLTFPLTMRVHYSNNYENAFWDGSSMTFGDGGNTFYPLVSLDVSSHEVSHGFTEQNSDLIYSGESGGINEAFSDMAGEAAEFYMKDSNDFLVGADIFKADGALRNMCNPTGSSIGHIDQYTSNLDVHYSSGIYNKVFCVLAQTQGWDTKKAFITFATANQNYWSPGTGFIDGAQDVIDAAISDTDKKDVACAFEVVGITGLSVSCSPEPEPTNPLFTAEGYKVKGFQHVRLTLSNVSVAYNIYRDSIIVATTSPGIEEYTDNIGVKGAGSYTYAACQAANTALCLDSVNVTF